MSMHTPAARHFLNLIFFSMICGCSPSSGAKGGNAPDLNRSDFGDQSPLARHDFNDAILDLGPLVVEIGERQAESQTRPWSSWWFPIKDRYLFDNGEVGNSPLEKYDRFSGLSSSGLDSAAVFEKEKLFDPGAGNWEGLCNAWSAASLMEPEPAHPVTVKEIQFSVGDLKALLVKSYEVIPGLKRYGQRYNGDSVSNFADLYPEQFHRVLQAELLEKGRPFIMDKDPGIPVWNTPVWKAQTQSLLDAHDKHLLHVTTWLFGASPFVAQYDFVGTLSVVFQYTYDLYGEIRDDSRFHVAFGNWTGDSIQDHPDFITVIPADLTGLKKNRASKNLNISPAKVDEILHSGATP